MDDVTFPFICIDAYPDDRGFDPVELPDPLALRSADRRELAMAYDKLWQVGQTIRVRFLDGSPALHARVAGYARQWLDYANLEFAFSNFPEADIRITFVGQGYWSLLGTDASSKMAEQHRPTMTLGGFTEHTPEATMRGVVLHEFGHALGCVHEQANPNFKVTWNKARVYADYKKVGWTQAMVDHNLFLRYGAEEVESTGHDPLSIMQYPIDKAHTLEGITIGWNTELSELDKELIGRMYPFPG